VRWRTQAAWRPRARYRTDLVAFDAHAWQMQPTGGAPDNAALAVSTHITGALRGDHARHRDRGQQVRRRSLDRELDDAD